MHMFIPFISMYLLTSCIICVYRTFMETWFDIRSLAWLTFHSLGPNPKLGSFSFQISISGNWVIIGNFYTIAPETVLWITSPYNCSSLYYIYIYYIYIYNICIYYNLKLIYDMEYIQIYMYNIIYIYTYIYIYNTYMYVYIYIYTQHTYMIFF